MGVRIFRQSETPLRGNIIFKNIHKVCTILTSGPYNVTMASYEDKQERMWRRAYEMATSGNFSGWITIEWELRFNEDFPEARRMLEDTFIRAELDELCDQARIPL